MAIGTLAVCYNNPGVFTGVVKLRRGQTALYMTSTKDMRSVYLAFAHFANTILQKCGLGLMSVACWHEMCCMGFFWARCARAGK